MEELHTQMIQSIAQTIYDKKGFNILAIDVRGVCTMTNFFIIAEGAVERHVQALNRELGDKLDEMGCEVLHVEGEHTGDWIALDCGDVVIHLFTPEMREKYAFDQLWTKGKLIELELKKEDE